MAPNSSTSLSSRRQGIVARLLDKPLIHFTKSRPRHTNDNGLVETKNGAVLRKQLGYAYIPQACAELLNGYHKAFLNPYVNFHRPCFFPVSSTGQARCLLLTVKARSRKLIPMRR
ncbi:MAG: hypothetical protein DDT28_00971 [Dehalococcoidia bacterium]|nr:hypothetical protein [Chloroflexota bacterium]MBT9166523.1 hypothetical protein [Chloroflexota bacterium]